ncbi:MAG: hypothetical protein JJE35_01930 [Thermoleophilia bacterium]|nr:hypothetical protein [Thermoleophilia bacterium]
MTITIANSSERVFLSRASRVPLLPASRLAGNKSMAEPRRVPAFISADQAYYWSREWQQDVLASMQALREGEFQDFDSDDPNDVARWLLSVDEDDCV